MVILTMHNIKVSRPLPIQASAGDEMGRLAMRARFWLFALFLLVVLSSMNTYYIAVAFLSKTVNLDQNDSVWIRVKSQAQVRISNASAVNALQTNPRPLCHREQLRFGQWTPVVLEAPPYISRTLHLRCVVEDYDFENPGPWKSWTWTPQDSRCRFANWDPEAFCDLLSFATVSIMGDSLSWEHFSSMMQLLGKSVRQTHQFVSRDERRNIVHFACNNGRRGTKFVWRNTALLNSTEVTESIMEDFPTVLILNRGAHYRNDADLVRELHSLFPVLTKWQTDCKKSEIKCHLFWRTTVPGHPNCPLYKEPINDLKRMEALVTSPQSYDNETWRWGFRWHDFQRQNLLVLRELAHYSEQYGLRYQILDAYEILLLRPDGHRWHQNDCLHNCYPGKIDVYSQLLLHLLTLERTQADAQAMIDRFQRYTRGTNKTIGSL